MLLRKEGQRQQVRLFQSFQLPSCIFLLPADLSNIFARLEQLKSYWPRFQDIITVNSICQLANEFPLSAGAFHEVACTFNVHK